MNDKNPEVTIYGFRASDNLEYCKLFSEGRDKVLYDHGFTGIVTNDERWHGSPFVYCFLAFDQDGLPTGGIRLERKFKGVPLPMEEKLVNKYPEVIDFIKQFDEEQIAEACGLWNSKNALPLHLAILFARLSAAIAPLLGYDRVLSFSSTYTYRLARATGAEMVKDLGEKGRFDFPSKEFQSSIFVCSDLVEYHDATPENRERMLSLRENPKQVFTEKNISTGLKVRYEIEL